MVRNYFLLITIPCFYYLSFSITKFQIKSQTNISHLSFLLIFAFLGNQQICNLALNFITSKRELLNSCSSSILFINRAEVNHWFLAFSNLLLEFYAFWLKHFSGLFLQSVLFFDMKKMMGFFELLVILLDLLDDFLLVNLLLLNVLFDIFG